MDVAFWAFTYITGVCLYFMIRMMFVHPDDFDREVDWVFISAFLWPAMPVLYLVVLLTIVTRKLNVWFHKTRKKTQ